MHDPQNQRPGEGERMHASLRRRFWMLVGGLALIGAVAGFVGSFVIEQSQSGGLSPTMQLLGAIGVGVALLLFAYGSWRFFVSVDELELADNLWGSLVGLYAYAGLLPAWWALWKLGIAAEPSHWAIYAAVLCAALVAYAYRKIRH